MNRRQFFKEAYKAGYKKAIRLIKEYLDGDYTTFSVDVAQLYRSLIKQIVKKYKAKYFPDVNFHVNVESRKGKQLYNKVEKYREEVLEQIISIIINDHLDELIKKNKRLQAQDGFSYKNAKKWVRNIVKEEDSDDSDWPEAWGMWIDYSSGPDFY